MEYPDRLPTAAACALAVAIASPPGLADEDEVPFKVANLIIELTEDDIELQMFIDSNELTSMAIEDPDERTIFKIRSRGRLKTQGLTELAFASEPSHYLEDEPDFDESVEDFLARFPEGIYEFEGRAFGDVELESEVVFTHTLPALPEILAPLEVDDEAPVLNIDDVVIEWEPVTTTFFGGSDIDIVEYQVIVEQVEPFRKSTTNLSAATTRYTVPVEFLEPGREYDVEVLAIEAGGNQTISVTVFETAD